MARTSYTTRKNKTVDVGDQFRDARRDASNARILEVTVIGEPRTDHLGKNEDADVEVRIVRGTARQMKKGTLSMAATWLTGSNFTPVPPGDRAE